MATKKPKIEGTSRTFGQHIIFSSDRDRNFFNSEGFSNKQKKYKTTKDKIIDVMRNTRDLEESLTHKTLSNRIIDFNKESKADVALAAASTNFGGTIALPARKKKRTKSSFFKKIFANFSNVAERIEEKVLVLGSSVKTERELQTLLKESKKVDLSITLKSIDSEIIQFSTVQVPSLESNFRYNFFIPEEKDIEEQEDPSKDPLLERDAFNVPRFVELRWEALTIKEPLSEQERLDMDTRDLRRKLFYLKRGFLNSFDQGIKNSVNRANKRLNLIERNGKSFKVTDIHDIEKGFDSITNKRKYKNTISTVINTNNNKNDEAPLTLEPTKEDNEGTK
jgi:hypothetical protein